MNGAADMGGMHGFGPVVPEPNEPVFHADWEKTSFALNMVTGVAKLWNLDAFRFKRESIRPRNISISATTDCGPSRSST